VQLRRFNFTDSIPPMPPSGVANEKDTIQAKLAS
jgi:hypothetical protein